jgi:hypothetical protein
MDRVLSARLDETIVSRIGNLARRLHTTKKQVIEGAIRLYATQVEKDGALDILAQTSGAWRRKQSPRQTRSLARTAFQRAMKRHHQ